MFSLSKERFLIRSAKGNEYNLKKRLSYGICLSVIAVVAGINLLPALFVFTNSFMSNLEAESRYTSIITAYNTFGMSNGSMHYMEWGFLPEVLTFSGLKHILLDNPIYLRFIWNSIILTIPIVAGQLAIAPLAAYGFELVRTRFKESLFFAYIVIMLMPLQATLVPNYIAARVFGIDGSYWSIIPPSVFSPFGVFLLRQQMKGFDRQMIEAARIDGASELKAFFKVVLPNLRPSMIALTVLAFAESWNIVDQAIVFIKTDYAMPMSVYLSKAVSGDIGTVFSLSTLFMIPALIVFIYGQDYLAEGINTYRLR